MREGDMCVCVCVLSDGGVHWMRMNVEIVRADADDVMLC
jgi:hypothetical protein